MTLPGGPLTPATVRSHIAPLFSRHLKDSGGRAYMANHSLGRPLDAVHDNVARALRLWSYRMDDSWEPDGWPEESNRFRRSIATLLGLSDGGNVVPKNSAGQGLRAVLNSFPQDRPVRVVASTGEFDSVDFILKSYVALGRAEVHWVGPTSSDGPVPLYEPASFIDAIVAGVDLVVVSAVLFTTGQVMPGLPDLALRARSLGAVFMVDAYHAVGALPFSMPDSGADCVIGGCYKYLRGGPGAGYLALSDRMLDRPGLRTLDTGWFAKRGTFHYDRPDEPDLSPGGDAWLESTPPVLPVYQATPGISFAIEVGVPRLRAYNLSLQEELRQELASLGLAVHLPRDPETFGAFVLVADRDADKLAAGLKSEGVVTDARGGFVRIGPDVLTTEDEIRTTARAMDRIVKSGG